MRGARVGERRERGPARVEHLVCVTGRQVVQPLPAGGAQPGTVRLAQRRPRQAEHHQVTHHRFEIEQVVLEPADLVLLRGLVGGAVRIGEQLTDVDRELLGDRVEAPPALAAQRSPMTVPVTSTPSVTDSSRMSSASGAPSGTPMMS